MYFRRHYFRRCSLGAIQIIRDSLGGGGVSKNVTRQFLLVIFLKIFFWFAPFGYLYFCYFLVCLCNSLHCLHPSSIQCRGLNPRPLGHEPSALTTRPWLSPQFLLVISLVKVDKKNVTYGAQWSYFQNLVQNIVF